MTKFHKYQGAGNDFIIIDLINQNYITTHELSQNIVKKLCNRNLGIGADGLMTLSKDPKGNAFMMKYWNNDGLESTMCGNGGRCIALFAHSINLSTNNNIYFNAIDGPHHAQIIDKQTVKLQMTNTDLPQKIDENSYLINTGSPHYIQFVDDVDKLDLKTIAPPLRYKYNANINFVDPCNLKIRTWERGVEGETLACGTGATAAAITLNYSRKITEQRVTLYTVCDMLTVDFMVSENGYNEVFLTGPAKKVFTGEIEILSIQ